MWNKNLNFNEIFRESVGNIIYPEIPICKKGSIHLVRDIRIKSTNSSPRLKTETGTSPSYLGDEMKLLSVLYRSFVYLSLGLVLGSLGSSGFAGLVSGRKWLRKHFFRRLCSRIVRSSRRWRFCLWVLEWWLGLISCFDGLMWRMRSRFVRLMLSDDLKSRDNGVWRLSDDFNCLNGGFVSGWGLDFSSHALRW